MGKQFEQLSQSTASLFVSAAAEGHVNVSPRDTASLGVLDANTAIYLDKTAVEMKLPPTCRAGR